MVIRTPAAPYGHDRRSHWLERHTIGCIDSTDYLQAKHRKKMDTEPHNPLYIWKMATIYFHFHTSFPKWSLFSTTVLWTLVTPSFSKSWTTARVTSSIGRKTGILAGNVVEYRFGGSLNVETACNGLTDAVVAMMIYFCIVRYITIPLDIIVFKCTYKGIHQCKHASSPQGW